MTGVQHRSSPTRQPHSPRRVGLDRRKPPVSPHPTVLTIPPARGARPSEASGLSPPYGPHFFGGSAVLITMPGLALNNLTTLPSATFQTATVPS